jgi:hypothetical protein
MLVSLLLLAAMAVVWLCPQTPLGRLLRRLLVEAPARMLNRLTPRKALFAIVAFVALAVLTAALPAELAMLAAVDVATYIEVLSAISLLGLAVRLRNWLKLVCVMGACAIRRKLSPAGAFIAGLAARARSPRRRSVRPPSADELDAPAFA